MSRNELFVVFEGGEIKFMLCYLIIVDFDMCDSDVICIIDI